MRKIYLFVSSVNYIYLVEYIQSFLPHTNAELIIYDSLIDYKFDTQSNNIYIFVQYIPPDTNIDKTYPHLYILNTEQLTINPDDKRNKISSVARDIVRGIRTTNIKLIDYSLANIRCINKPSKYIPYCVNHQEIYNYPKTLDVAFITPRSKYRKKVYRNLLTNNIKTTSIRGFGQERDEQLFRHKILINVHNSPAYNIFEEIRCNRCIFNKMIVITQASKHFDTHPLKKYMIECNLNEIVTHTKRVLTNYEQIHQQIFQDFNLQEIDQMYQNYLTNTINQITN